MPATLDRSFVSRKEVAQIFHVSPATVTRWAKHHRLPWVMTLGGHHRYPKEEILKLAQVFSALTEEAKP